MVRHAPKNYKCPFCLIVQGVEREGVATTKGEIILREEGLTVFIGSHQWPNNPGNTIIIPNEHFENLYELPDRYGEPLLCMARRIALAMKEAFQCPGTSTRQHNEPAGGQDVWHYHLHVFPRFEGDELYRSERRLVPVEERIRQALRLRAALKG